MGLTLISSLVDSQETEDRGRRGHGALIVRAVGEGICWLAWQRRLALQLGNYPGNRRLHFQESQSSKLLKHFE